MERFTRNHYGYTLVTATDETANQSEIAQQNTSAHPQPSVNPAKAGSSKYAWVSPLVLCALFILLVAATRVYVGGPGGVIFVWKGELSFIDTVVNLVDYANLPKEELAKHPQLVMQMEEMDLLDPSNEGFEKRKRIRKNSAKKENSQAPAQD